MSKLVAEVFVGTATDAGGDAGTWYTLRVELPQSTPKRKLRVAAEKAALEELERNGEVATFVAFGGYDDGEQS